MEGPFLEGLKLLGKAKTRTRNEIPRFLLALSPGRCSLSWVFSVPGPGDGSQKGTKSERKGVKGEPKVSHIPYEHCSSVLTMYIVALFFFIDLCRLH